MPAGGDRRIRRVPLLGCLSGSHRAVPSRRSPRARPLSRRTLVHPRTHPRAKRDTTPPPRISVPQRTKPDLFRARFTLLRRADHLTDAHQAHLDRLFDAHPRLRTAWEALQELYQLYEAEDLDGANQALGRFADLYATGQIPEYHQIVDTIVAWGEEILAYHTTRRVSNGPLEGINNLLQVLRRVAHGFTNPDNYASRAILVA